jgi:DNA transformation protein
LAKIIENEFLDFILESLGSMEGISWGSMFGGFVIRQYDLPFGLIFDDELYLKVNKGNLLDYKALGSEPFSYSKKGKIINISNWRVPAEVLEDPDTIVTWAKKAVQAAQDKKRGNKPLNNSV